MQTPYSPEESLLIRQGLSDCERGLSELEASSIPSRNLENLNLARIGSSNSLLKDPHLRARWDQAQTQIQNWIFRGDDVTWERILQLQDIVTGTAGLRDHAIFTGRHEHAAASDLPDLVEWLKERLSELPSLHPVEGGALLRYWMVSIHPFSDGNGRISTLAADWILLKNGYPPFCFTQVIDGTVAAVPGSKDFATPARAVLKSLEALQASLKILRN